MRALLKRRVVEVLNDEEQYTAPELYSKPDVNQELDTNSMLKYDRQTLRKSE